MIHKMASGEDFQIVTKGGGTVTVPSSTTDDTLVKAGDLFSLLEGKTYDFETNAGLYLAVMDVVEALGGTIVNPPVLITGVTMGEFPENEVGFDDNIPIVLHGVNLSYNAGAGDTLKIELCPNKGAAITVLDQLDNITVSADGTTLSFVNWLNSSDKPDGSWWGRDALVTLTTGGKTATFWVTFHDWS